MKPQQNHIGDDALLAEINSVNAMVARQDFENEMLIRQQKAVAQMRSHRHRSGCVACGQWHGPPDVTRAAKEATAIVDRRAMEEMLLQAEQERIVQTGPGSTHRGHGVEGHDSPRWTVAYPGVTSRVYQSAIQSAHPGKGLASHVKFWDQGVIPPTWQDEGLVILDEVLPEWLFKFVWLETSMALAAAIRDTMKSAYKIPDDPTLPEVPRCNDTIYTTCAGCPPGRGTTYWVWPDCQKQQVGEACSPKAQCPVLGGPIEPDKDPWL